MGEEMRMLVLVGQESNHTSCSSHLYDEVPVPDNLKEKGIVQLRVSEVVSSSWCIRSAEKFTLWQPGSRKRVYQ